jgi:Flp pilus assembly protein TadD
MKRFARWVLCLFLFGAAGAWAQSPDDAFIRVYNLIQQGDTLLGSGQARLADEKYLEALAGLAAMEKDYPQWNPTIIKFRKDYIAKRLSPGAATAVAQTKKPVAPGTPATPPKADLPDERLQALDRELQEMRRERELLQAKLREALTVQPAPIDPREMQQAEERIRQLREENQALRNTMTEQKDQLARTTDSGALEAAQRNLADTAKKLDRQTALVAELTQQNDTLEKRLRQKAPPVSKEDSQALAAAQKDLKTARAELDRQTELVAELTREKKALDEELKRAKDKAAARGANPRALAEAQAALKEARSQLDQQNEALIKLKREKESLDAELKQARAATATKPTATTTDGNAARQIEDLQRKLKQAQSDLQAQTQRADVLAAEKATMENRLAELAKQPAAATAVTAPATTTPAVPPPVASRAQTKAEKRAAKASEEQINALQKERAELQKQLAKLHGQVEDMKVRQKGTGQMELQRQLDLARARLAAYEAKPVPYSAEELTLFQPTVQPAAGGSNTTARVTKPLPAGAAPLIAEAQRAFQANQLDEAENKYAEAVKLDERNVTMLTDLAATQLQRGRLAEAEATLNKALAEDTENAAAVTYLGLLRYRQDRLDEAVDLLSRGARLNPDSAIAQNYLGIALSAKGQRGPAEAALRRAVSLQPGYAEAHANLAIVYALQKPPFLELARWHYQKARSSGYAANPEVEKVLNEPAAPGK